MRERKEGKRQGELQGLFWTNTKIMRKTGGITDPVRVGKVHSAQQGLHLRLGKETEDSKVITWIPWNLIFSLTSWCWMKPSEAHLCPSVHIL